MELIISEGQSRWDKHWTPKTYSWPDFVNNKLRYALQTAETMEQYASMDSDSRTAAKDHGGFVGGHVEGERKGSNVTNRQLLALDADYADESFWDTYQLFGGWCAVCHSTHSSTPEKRRYRLLIPMTRVVSRKEYEAIGRMVASKIGIDCFDSTTYQPGRLMFYPTVCKDAQYEFYDDLMDADWLDPDDILKQYHNWHDRKEWPRGNRETKAIGETVAKLGDPREKPGYIGAFCRVYTVSAAIDCFLSDIFIGGYGRRYRYKDSNSQPGAVVYDDDMYLWDNHETDPYSGHCQNAYDLVRLHLFGELDKDQDEETKDNVNNRPSTKAMFDFCASLPDVQQEYVESFGTEGDNGILFEGDYSDQNVARSIAGEYRGQLLFHESLGWLYWDSMRWKTDSKPDSMKLQFRYYDTMMRKAQAAVYEANFEGPDEQKAAKAFLQKVSNMRNARKILGVEQIMRNMLPLGAPDKLDTYAWELNTPGGTVDLKTGELMEHNPEHLHTHITQCTPERGTPELWMRCLDYWTSGKTGDRPDEELKEYLQIIAGMCCIGEIRNEGLFIVYGEGGNGKSTMFNVWRDLLGDYAGPIDSKLLIENSHGGEKYGLADTRGKRLVIMSELDENARMSVSTMKTLTSRDAMQVNPKYAKTFSFTPSHTLILHTNHLPKLNQLDTGTKRRLAVIPFDAPMKKPGEIIPDLAERLVKEEGPQILLWMIDGARKYWNNGCILTMPKSVIDSTKSYIDSENWLIQFVNECCQFEKELSVPAGRLYSAYVSWANQNNERVKSSSAFKKAMEENYPDLEHVRNTKGITWYGVGLVDSDEF